MRKNYDLIFIRKIFELNFYLYDLIKKCENMTFCIFDFWGGSLDIPVFVTNAGRD